MENDALSAARFGGGLFLSDFPAKIRVLTLDPVVSNDNYGNTKYAFVVWCHDDNKPHILNKGPGIAQRLSEIHTDPDFGGDLRKIDLKITTNGKSGIEIRYTITPVGAPYQLPAEQIKEAATINLESVVKNGIRLSEVNQGKRIPSANLEPESTDEIAEVDDAPINLDDIPF